MSDVPVDLELEFEEQLSALHKCPALAKDERKARRALSVPPALRGVDDPSAWPRRHLKLDGHDLLGDPEADDEFSKGATMLAIQMSSLKLCRSMARQLSLDHFDNDDRVSISQAIDLAIRWYIQHPPPQAWALGVLAKWVFEHRKGRPSSKYLITPDREAAANGLTIAQVLERRREARVKRTRELLEVMQGRDLNADEVSGGVDLEWVKTGKLVIPKDVRKLMAVGNDEVTRPLPFREERA